MLREKIRDTFFTHRGEDIENLLDEYEEYIYMEAFEVVVSLFENVYDQDCSSYREAMEAYLERHFNDTESESDTIH